MLLPPLSHKSHFMLIMSERAFPWDMEALHQGLWLCLWMPGLQQQSVFTAQLKTIPEAGIRADCSLLKDILTSGFEFFLF